MFNISRFLFGKLYEPNKPNELYELYELNKLYEPNELNELLPYSTIQLFDYLTRLCLSPITHHPLLITAFRLPTPDCRLPTVFFP